MADMISILALIAMIVPVVSIVKLILPKSLIFSNADRFIKSRTMILIINITYLKTALTAFLNFQSTTTSSDSSTFNMMTSIVGIVYLGLVPAFYAGHMIMFYREIKSLRKKLEYSQVFSSGSQNVQNNQVVLEKVTIIKNNFRYKVLFEEYNIDSMFQYGYMIYFTLSKAAYAIILTQLYEYPDYQLVFANCLAITNIVWIAGM
jgi:hypothetical protein